MNEVKTGTYTGTGAAQDIIIGFVPDHVRIVSDADAADWEWFSGMAAASAYATAAAGDRSKVAANGISAYSGPKGMGFTIGTALSANTVKFRYVAVRGGAGAQG